MKAKRRAASGNFFSWISFPLFPKIFKLSFETQDGLNEKKWRNEKKNQSKLSDAQQSSAFVSQATRLVICDLKIGAIFVITEFWKSFIVFRVLMNFRCYELGGEVCQQSLTHHRSLERLLWAEIYISFKKPFTSIWFSLNFIAEGWWILRATWEGAGVKEWNEIFPK